jgi:hypothetical protein
VATRGAGAEVTSYRTADASLAPRSQAGVAVASESGGPGTRSESGVAAASESEGGGSCPTRHRGGAGVGVGGGFTAQVAGLRSPVSNGGEVGAPGAYPTAEVASHSPVDVSSAAHDQSAVAAAALHPTNGGNDEGDLPAHSPRVHRSLFTLHRLPFTAYSTPSILHPRLYTLVPSLIEGLRVVQGLRVVPVFLYRYSMQK